MGSNFFSSPCFEWFITVNGKTGENAVAAVCGGSSVGKHDKMDQGLQEKRSYSSVF